jgi:hypothetical protein
MQNRKRGEWFASSRGAGEAAGSLRRARRRASRLGHAPDDERRLLVVLSLAAARIYTGLEWIADAYNVVFAGVARVLADALPRPLRNRGGTDARRPPPTPLLQATQQGS